MFDCINFVLSRIYQVVYCELIVGKPLNVHININVNDISSISEVKMVFSQLIT